MKGTWLCILFFLITDHSIDAQEVFTYQTPPKELFQLFESSNDTELNVSTDGKWIVYLSRPNYPAINDIAFTSINLMQLTLDVQNFTPASQRYINRIVIKTTAGGEIAISGLPQNLRAAHTSWSPDGKKMAFTQTLKNRVDLYTIDIAAKKATKVNKRSLHIAMGKAYEWTAGNVLIYKVALHSSEQVPSPASAPNGVFVYGENARATADPYSSGAIRSEYDAELFRFYATSQLVRNNAGIEQPLARPAIYTDFSVSPDGNYIVATTINNSFSLASRIDECPSSIIIMDRSGKPVKKLIEYPANVSYLKKARLFGWHSNKAAAITWMQPIDTGVRKTQGLSSILYCSEAPFTQSKEWFKTELPLSSVTWSNEGIVLVSQLDRRKGIQRFSVYDEHKKELSTVYEQNPFDFNNRLGVPVTISNQYGREILLMQDEGTTILINNILGNTASGQQPFLAKWNFRTRGMNYLWRSSDAKENIFKVVDPAKSIFLIHKKTGNSNYQYVLQHTGSTPKESVLIDHRIPSPFDGAAKQTIQYRRADGVILSGTLYLPKGYDPGKDGRLPLFFWSYPRRFYSRDEYKPEESSEKTYGVSIDTWEAPQMFVARGYAVFEAGMAILPDSTENANDHFIDQLVMNAEAGIKKLADDGIVDPGRVAVGGHSYGASMTTLLLANTKLFKAGIAMSGSYNRMNTPFGFQDERRSYWQARDVYNKLSSFAHADKIKTPLLLIHGSLDRLAGTPVKESEDLFKAVNTAGGTARFVNLPYEDHGYEAKESILHMIWEMNQWLDKYVKYAGK